MPESRSYGRIVFRPGEPYAPTPELTEKIQHLIGAGKYRSALDELFAILARNPADPEALTLALIVLSASRTTQIQSAEPLGPRYLYDRRLDPLCAVCSQCGSSWVASNVKFADLKTRLSMMNPVGLQCNNCSFTLCRKCLKSIYFGGGMGVFNRSCPKCATETLGVPVYPTGRPPMQLGRRPEHVAALIVFREGPVPPGREYIEELAEARSPDALDDKAELIGVPVNPWPDDIESHARDKLAVFVGAGRISSAGALDPEAATLTDESGTRVHLVKMYQAPPSAPIVPVEDEPSIDAEVLRCRIPELRAAADRLHPGVNRLVGRMLVEHLERLAVPSQAGRLAGETWSALFSTEVLDTSREGLLETLRKALLADQHEWAEVDRPEIRLVLSSIPQASAARAQAYFTGGYLAFVERQRLEASAGGKGFGHWIVCSDGQNVTIHLSCCPAEAEALMLLAQDLMTAAEWARGMGR
jgi:hypothetical protein